MSTLVEIDSAVKAFGTRRALQGLNLRMNRGDLLGLLGPNGAGKSTTMALIAGLIEPDSGTVSVFGARASLRSTRARVGFAPQALALYGELTAEENLRFFGELFGCERRALDSAVSRALSLAGLEARRTDRVRTFSGGMQRRLNLACAVVHSPALLLLDEPTVGVDPQSRAHLFDALLRLARDGMAIAYSTHYMEEAETLCNRIVILDEGAVVAEGSKGELVRLHGGPERTVVAAPNLESVFMNLTGRSLRD